jgi:BirA family biotin operon repressor/biotin-[acetyl-CoA-carboxylase] ligase
MQAQTIGGRVIELDSVDSTNNYAAERLGLPEMEHGTVILAQEQTAGRGQRGRTWISAKGLDLTFSLVLRPESLKATSQFVLSKVAALALHDVVAEALKASAGLGGGEVRIKWPNDILIGDRKVAGILIQNELAGERVVSSVVGIGLNVNSSDLHAGLLSTSLRAELGHPLERSELLELFLARFAHYWSLAADERERLDRAYRGWLWGRDRVMPLELDGSDWKGVPVDVDELGRLLVRDPLGRVQAYGLDRLRFTRLEEKPGDSG